MLHLFDLRSRHVNPNFIRQLVSLLILQQNLCLPWTNPKSCDKSSKDFKRTNLLAIWVGPQSAPVEWGWAITAMLSHLQGYAERVYGCPRRPPEFVKILSDNLDSLSRLAGFTGDFTWYSNPSSTLRFMEILAKIYASDFTVGELIMLFTTEEHLRGDDPYPFTEESEAQDDPLNAPEDHIHGLWDLRRKLLDVEVTDADTDIWTWSRIRSACNELGLKDVSNSLEVDILTFMGMHFFPSTLQCSGYVVDTASRRFSTPLAASSTTPELWTGTHCDAFHYTYHAQKMQSGELWAELPLKDEKVFHQLLKSRQLNPKEAEAVRNLYFAPRAALAPFALIFSNFGLGVEMLIHDPDEQSRFRFFQREFATFYTRCRIIVTHLAEQVDRLPCWTFRNRDCGCGGGGDKVNEKASWRILTSLVADENQATTRWEDDSGEPPKSFAFNRFSGNGFAALLGLIGTGLRGNLTTSNGLNWPEMRGGISAFEQVRNEWNIPVPTLISSLTLQPLIQQQDLVAFRNGFALHDDHATALGGAQPFTGTWSGLLLVEEKGRYTFSAGHPKDCCEMSAHEIEKGQKWLITLQRGQKTWPLLNRCWENAHDAPCHQSKPLWLSKGVYNIVIKFEQAEPKFTDELSTQKLHTGFEVKYCGPDTECRRCTLPYHHLFQDYKEGPLACQSDEGGNLGTWLNNQYHSSFRDIRRTYQRAFKSILFARRFNLSAHEDPCDGQSELGFLIGHPDRFQGTSYYSSEHHSWKTHHAYLDFNFWPVTDSYFPYDVAIDSRVSPSLKRKAALFDWWERIFDYTHLRCVVGKLTCGNRRSRGILKLFYEADTQKPSNAYQLIPYFHAELSLAAQVLTFYVKPGELYEVLPSDLLDERWATRVFKAVRWLQGLNRKLYAKTYKSLMPALVAADDPSEKIGEVSGNTDMAAFVMASCEHNPNLLENIKCVNDGLRDRARDALLAYLCGMNRVRLALASPEESLEKFAVIQDLASMEATYSIPRKLDPLG